MEIKEAIRHCREVTDRVTTRGECLECAVEYEQLVAWLEELEAYRATGLTPECVALLRQLPAIFDECDFADPIHFQGLLDKLKKIAQAEKNGRLVVLPDGEDNASLAATVDKADKIKTWSGGNRDLMIGLLSLLVGKVADQIGTTYKDLLMAMMAEPPILVCREAEEALREEAEHG